MKKIFLISIFVLFSIFRVLGQSIVTDVASPVCPYTVVTFSSSVSGTQYEWVVGSTMYTTATLVLVIPATTSVSLRVMNNGIWSAWASTVILVYSTAWTVLPTPYTQSVLLGSSVTLNIERTNGTSTVPIQQWTVPTNVIGVVNKTVYFADEYGCPRATTYEMHIVSSYPCTDCPPCPSCGVTAVEEVADENEIIVYPNPVSDKLSINFNNGQFAGTVKIVSVQGVTLLEQNISKGTETIFFDISSLEVGVYFVSGVSEKGTWTERIIVVEGFLLYDNQR